MMDGIKKFFKAFCEAQKRNRFTPSYRLVEIMESETGEHIVTVQISNKSIVFKTKPEEILAHDNLVDQFSPRDVRTLTYLGYLSLNNPKYKILAQRLSETNDKTLFAIRKKGDKKIIVKTADEILKEKDILDNLSGKDSHLVGYTIASENIIREKQEKEKLARSKHS